MTVLIDTHHWLVEFEARCLFVTDRITGLSATLQGDRIASDVRDCLKTHAPDQVGACYARIARSLKCDWEAHYKRLPPVGGYLDLDDRRPANSPMARLIIRVRRSSDRSEIQTMNEITGHVRPMALANAIHAHIPSSWGGAFHRTLKNIQDCIDAGHAS